LAARARPCAARTRLFGLIAKQTGRCAPPTPTIAALLLLILFPEIDKNYQTRPSRFVDPSGNMRKKGFIFMLAKHIEAILRGFFEGTKPFFLPIWVQNYV
jgi:hypothetical protein